MKTERTLMAKGEPSKGDNKGFVIIEKLDPKLVQREVNESNDAEEMNDESFSRDPILNPKPLSDGARLNTDTAGEDEHRSVETDLD